jgi:hypothetical protein
MLVRAIDTLLAIKVIGLVPGLSTTDRRVASLLLEHYTRRTGQCDPGLERIARLLGVSTRTVIRSNHKLERASRNLLQEATSQGRRTKELFEQRIRCGQQIRRRGPQRR